MIGLYDGLYGLWTPDGRYPLPITFRPSTLAPTGSTPNLVRARLCLTQHNLADGLPDPGPVTLAGTVFFDSEDGLNVWLAELRTALNAATAYERGERGAIPLGAGSNVAAAPLNNHSGHATVVLTLIPAAVPDPASTLSFW